VLLRESPQTDVEKAAQQAAAQLRHGLGNGFYGELLTHEQKFSVLNLAQWERILARAMELTSRDEKIFCHHEQIGEYLRAREGVRIAAASSFTGSGRVTLVGAASQALRLSVFEDVGEGVERRYLEVPAFAGQVTVETR
jgi:hypothetical protein